MLHSLGQKYLLDIHMHFHSKHLLVLGRYMYYLPIVLVLDMLNSLVQKYQLGMRILVRTQSCKFIT